MFERRRGQGTLNTAAGFIGEDMPRKLLDAFVVIQAPSKVHGGSSPAPAASQARDPG